MKILLFGASGFIGKRVAARLREQGHQLWLPSHQDWDFTRPNEQKLATWLQGIDVVVNTVGVMSHDAEKLESVHHHAPAAIARAARQAGVRRLVQLSALGARPDHPVAFLGSKGRGDEAVCHSGLQVRIARPSVVFGRGGASCELFIRLAKLPVLPLPEGGYYRLQPVHIDDVAEGLCRLAVQEGNGLETVEMTGGQVCSLAEYLALLRSNIHHKKPPCIIALAAGLINMTAKLARVSSKGMFSPDSMALLRAGSVADAGVFERLLGRKPLSVKEFR